MWWKKLKENKAKEITMIDFQIYIENVYQNMWKKFAIELSKTNLSAEEIVLKADQLAIEWKNRFYEQERDHYYDYCSKNVPVDIAGEWSILNDLS